MSIITLAVIVYAPHDASRVTHYNDISWNILGNYCTGANN
jgi:hypothetical protein